MGKNMINLLDRFTWTSCNAIKSFVGCLQRSFEQIVHDNTEFST